jgi:hypothetical protein
MSERLWELLVNLLVILDFALELLARLAVMRRGQ